MNAVPVTNQRQNEQYQRDHQQSCGFGGVDGMPLMPSGDVVVAVLSKHAAIVALENSAGSSFCIAHQACTREFAILLYGVDDPLQ